MAKKATKRKKTGVAKTKAVEVSAARYKTALDQAPKKQHRDPDPETDFHRLGARKALVVKQGVRPDQNTPTAARTMAGQALTHEAEMVVQPLLTYEEAILLGTQEWAVFPSSLVDPFGGTNYKKGECMSCVFRHRDIVRRFIVPIDVFVKLEKA